MIHALKTWPEHFEKILNGRKRFELRKDDGRGFRVGDTLLLREWYRPALRTSSGPRESETAGYSGRTQCVLVRSIVDDEQFGLKPGYVCMSIDLPSGAESAA